MSNCRYSQRKYTYRKVNMTVMMVEITERYHFNAYGKY